MIFLIDYDRSTGRIVKMIVFQDDARHEAEDARLEVELALRESNGRREIVILEAESEENLRRTHRRYFETLEELTKLPPPRKNGGSSTSGF